MSNRIINGVEALGSPLINRRDALRGLGMAAAGLIGARISGASASTVGLSGEFDDAKFRSIGGFVEDSTLMLPSGQSVIVGKYGNPVLAPAAFHAAPLSELNPAIVNLSELGSLFAQQDPATKLKDLRAYKFLIKEGNSYKQIDLSEQLLNPPTVKVHANGALEVKSASGTLIDVKDGVYVKALYHVDINRIDPNAFIAICEQHEAPTSQNPIAVLELGSPILVSENSLLGWQGSQNIDFTTGELATRGDSLDGTTFIRSGANLWRYMYSADSSGKCVLQVDCKAHSEKPDAEWAAMGVGKFYQLVQEGLGTVINPEPYRKSSMLVSDLVGADTDLFGTGLIVWSILDGKVKKDKFSLTNLADKGEVQLLPGGILRLSKDGQRRDAKIIELKRKPGFAADTVDLIAIDSESSLLASHLPGSAFLTDLGGYDFMAAYRDTRELIARA